MQTLESVAFLMENVYNYNSICMSEDIWLTLL